MTKLVMGPILSFRDCSEAGDWHPGSNRYVMASRNWLAIELAIGKSGQDGSKLWATWRCETDSSFSNHLLAVEPVSID